MDSGWIDRVRVFERVRRRRYLCCYGDESNQGGPVIRTALPVKKALKPKRCRHCGNSFAPISSMSKACSVPCALALNDAAKKKSAAKALKVERKSMKERAIKLKTRREWIAEAQVAVNKVARLRDQLAGYGCISCEGRPKARYGGGMDAGHYRSVGSAPHMRYYLTQICGQCKQCNRDYGGMSVEFRRGLIERIGVNRVEEIEAMQGAAKWDIDYLKRLKKVMQKKARRLEKRIAEKAEVNQLLEEVA
nr:recombination protein NinG [Paraburkholderia phenazinium]